LDDYDFKPYNLDYFALYLFSSMLNSRFKRIQEEISALRICLNVSRQIKEAENRKENLSKDLPVGHYGFWKRIGFYLDHGIGVDDYKTYTYGEITKEENEINEKGIKLRDAKDSVLIHSPEISNETRPEYFENLINKLYQTQRDINSAIIKLTGLMPKGNAFIVGGG
jgi:hypothetical protein